MAWLCIANDQEYFASQIGLKFNKISKNSFCHATAYKKDE
jgi:hypothetical protein